ncbi:MAG: DUF748 domain-containing protein [Pseudomonadota bacterium]|nr:DUF748 domain-containing protein [Pseudomonadota bacterium]
MTTLTARLKHLSWKHLSWKQWTLVALVLFYLLYIALSYLYLPGKLKQVVETDVAQQVGRDITVERFEYNPFDLSLRVFGLYVPDKPDAPLLAWDQFYVNFTPWGSLFGWVIKLEAVQLDKPVVNLDTDGHQFNFSDILERFATAEDSEEQTAEEAEAASADSTGIALEISRTAINDGFFRFTDFSGAQPARSEMDNVTIELSDLYLATGDEHLNPFNITAAIPGGGALKMAGQYRVDPLLVETELDASGVELKEFSDFVTNVIPIKVADGQLALNGALAVQQQGDEVAVTARLEQLAVTGLALDDRTLDPPMARVSAITLGGVEFDLLQQSLTITSVRVDGPVLHQWLDENGKPRFEHLLVQEVVEENIEQQAPAKPEEESAPWNVVVNSLALAGGEFYFSDKNPGITQSHSVTALTVDLQNLTLTEGETVPVAVSARLDQQGELKVDGSMTLVPFKMQLNYGLANLPLPAFSEYVELGTYLRIEKGALQLEGNIALDTEGDMPIQSQLALTVDGFQAEDTRTGKPVVQFKQLQLQDMNLDTQARNVQVGGLVLTEPNLLLAVDAEKQMNWATITKPAASGSEETPAGETAPDTTESTPDWQYRITKVEILNGLTRFEDRSLSPVFKTGLHNLDFKLDTVASDGTQPVPFSLTSKIDRYAPFSVKGTLDPIAQQPGFEFKSTLQGLEMPALSPYSAQFIAYNLQSGKLSLDLDYSLHNSKLKGGNKLVADQLYLGEEVPNDEAIDAPVALGLALLRDVNGVIDLDVGVAGDLDDPGFNVSGIILKAFVNVLVKAATSPFQLLGSLVGSGEDMGAIDFDAGFATLTAENQTRLQQLVEALAQRPQLVVTFSGAASPQEDTPMLKKLRIQERVAEARKMSLEELREEAGDQDWWTVRANRRAIENINDELKLADESAREDGLQAAQPDLKGDALEAAVYQGMYEDVAAQQNITNTDLLALADRRALAIKQHLVDVLQLDHARVTVSKSRSGDLQGRIVNLGLDAR